MEKLLFNFQSFKGSLLFLCLSPSTKLTVKNDEQKMGRNNTKARNIQKTKNVITHNNSIKKLGKKKKKKEIDTGRILMMKERKTYRE